MILIKARNDAIKHSTALPHEKRTSLGRKFNDPSKDERKKRGKVQEIDKEGQKQSPQELVRRPSIKKTGDELKRQIKHKHNNHHNNKNNREQTTVRQTRKPDTDDTRSNQIYEYM